MRCGNKVESLETKLESATVFIENVIRYGAMAFEQDGQKAWAMLRELNPKRAEDLAKELDQLQNEWRI
tara:strand:- start:9347 stop:9550 length:204 start_codon:yes stop_codon:yes gene_type:complete